MKTLVLLRHSQTEDSYSGQKDAERELTNAGISDAIFKGQLFKDNKIDFNFFISSTAIRAKQTAELVAEQVGYTIRNIHYRDEIYLASTRTMLSEINLIEDKYNTVLLVAHNPGTEFIAEYITGDDIGQVPTSGTIKIELEIDSWQEVSQGLGKLIWKDFSQSQ